MVISQKVHEEKMNILQVRKSAKRYFDCPQQAQPKERLSRTRTGNRKLPVFCQHVHCKGNQDLKIFCIP